MIDCRADYIFKANAIPGGLVIGEPSRLLDAWSSSPLVFLAPAFHYPPFQVSFQLTDGQSDNSQAQARRFRNWFPRKAASQVFGDSQIVFDARHDDNGNIAHILQNQIGVALVALEALGIESRVDDLVFVVRPGTPEYAIQLYAAFGFRAVRMDGVARGLILEASPHKLMLRALASKWLRRRAEQRALVDNTVGKKGRVFIARRGRRSLTNFEAVRQLLQDEGFTVIFPEQLPIEEQISSIVNAQVVFGMHGAALGYLLLRKQEPMNSIVIESFPFGYATNWCRAMCAVVGDSWVGMVGNMDASVLRSLQTKQDSRAFEANNYAVNVDSLKELFGNEFPQRFLNSDASCMASVFPVKVPQQLTSQPKHPTPDGS